jgi:hypothetical protein
MKRASLLVLLAGCPQVYGVESVGLLPGVDTDGDGVLDRDDNCPGVPNAPPDGGTQADLDRDGIGDACDDCPVVADPAQDHKGDDDEIGDDCDPHPGTNGDCLILLDTFRATAGVAANWTVVGDGDVTTAPDGHVLLQPSAGGLGVALLAKGADGQPLSQICDVEVVASGGLTPGTGKVDAVSNFVDMNDRSACRLLSNGGGFTSYSVNAIDQAGGSPGALLSTLPIRDDMLLRVTSEDSDGKPTIACRVDYGVAVGIITAYPASPASGGAPGVYATVDPLVLDAIAIYEFDPNAAACPSPIIR